jgi:L-lactate dehydrogenase complex protein LldE
VHYCPASTVIYNQLMRTAQLFVTCLVDTFFPEVGAATVRLLRRCGVHVEFPREQTCCGQPMFNAGLREDARKVAEHTLRVFVEADGDIVMPSGSCAHMIRHNYVELFRQDEASRRRAEQLASRTYELTEYLVDVLGITEFQAQWDGPITYHPTCHLHRGLQVDRAPRLLLEHVRGAELLELPEAEDCCGFGGGFSMEHPELSTEMLRRKIRNLEATNAPTLVVCDSGCLMHLQGGLRRSGRQRKVVHIAEVLASTQAVAEQAKWPSHDRK